MRHIVLSTIALSIVLQSGAFAQTVQEKAKINADANATRHEEGVLSKDVKNHTGNVHADEKVISHDEAVQRRDSHNDAVERRNERNKERYEKKHERKM